MSTPPKEQNLHPSEGAASPSAQQIHKAMLDAISNIRSQKLNILTDKWVLGPDHLFHHMEVTVKMLTAPLAALFVNDTPFRWISHARQEMNRIRIHMQGRRGEAVLLIGEKGTGKLSLTQTAHFISERSDKPFVYAVCSSSYPHPPRLSGKGIERFASGLNYMFHKANGGTIYFENVEELSYTGMELLADIIQSGRYRTPEGRSHDFTGVIMCATHADLFHLESKGRIPPRLMNVLHGNIIRVLSLNDVSEDVPDMAETMLEARCKLEGCTPKKFTDAAREKLRNHRWTMNIKELYLLSCQMAIHCGKRVIDADDLYFGADYEKKQSVLTEEEELKRALREARGNEIWAAEALKCSRHTVRNRKEKHGLDKNYGRPGYEGYIGPLPEEMRPKRKGRPKKK